MSKNKPETVTHIVSWHWGKDEPPATVEVKPGEWIRIKGAGTVHRAKNADGVMLTYRPKFDRTFKVGDVVEYGSWNLRYTGPIVSIGPKLVKVDCSGTGERCKNMTHQDFVCRNWDLDLEEVAKHNSTEMLYI